MGNYEDIRLLALDLDGTLLTKDKKLTDMTRQTLTAAMQAGIEPVYVTGRPLQGMPEEAMALPGIRYVITSNGAVTTDLATGETLRAAFLSSETAEAIARMPEERGLLYNIFIDGLGYSSFPVYERLIEAFSDTPLSDYVRQSRRPSDNLHALFAASGNRVENIWIRAKDRGERDEINEKIRKLSGLQTVLTAETDVEAGAQNADKGLALADLARRLKIEKRNILAIGDNENDLGMFSAAGVSVAMGNASAHVKKQASTVTGTNEENGAAEAIAFLCRLKL